MLERRHSPQPKGVDGLFAGRTQSACRTHGSVTRKKRCVTVLEYIAGMPAFRAEGLTAADFARVRQAERFLLLLNGWNEIAETNSAEANNALRELERDFSSAGIIVATCTHHLTSPLPGALRLRLLCLRRVQRTAYLVARLGAKGTELRTRIDTDPSPDELTRTPSILSEVASLFEAGAKIPSTKIDILAEVLRLQEQRDEHRNALQTTASVSLQRVRVPRPRRDQHLVLASAPAHDAGRKTRRRCCNAHRYPALGTEAFVPLSFEWSEAFQFDWSEEGLVIGWDSHVGGSRHPEDAEPVVPLTANEQRPARFQRAGAPRSAAVECLLELRDVELHLS